MCENMVWMYENMVVVVVVVVGFLLRASSLLSQ
jgi:hypothetical protein